MAFFPLVIFILAVARPSEERYGATLRALAGIAVPLAVTVAYFYYHDALGDFLEGFVLFNVLYLVRGGSMVWQIAAATGVVATTYSTMLVPIVIGLIMILRLYFLRPFEYRFAPILLSFPGPFLFSLLDFQLADDFFVFLPYVAVGFGSFLAIATQRAKNPRLVGELLGAFLLVVALATTFDAVNASTAYALKGTTIGLNQQKEGAEKIEERFGEDVRLASINSPQVLVLLHKKNPNPYLWITAGVDQEIEAETPGGFEGWLEGLEASDLDAISFFGEGQSLLPSPHLTTAHNQELERWLDPRYRAEKIGPWWLLVKNSLTSEAERKARTES